MKTKQQLSTFGRHESFPLRFSWLPKGFQTLCDNPGIFQDDNATIHLGVGKNMVNAIRYWLYASQIISPINLKPTPVGKFIFDSKTGADPYLEDEATLWLIHWLLASNPQYATAIFWFFNGFHKAEFKTKEVQEALKHYADTTLHTKTSVKTIYSDAVLALRMYAEIKESKKIPLEDALDAPMAILGLIERGATSQSYYSLLGKRPTLPLHILAFSIAQMFQKTTSSSMPMESLMYSKGQMPAPGAVFRLTEEGLTEKLEQMTREFPNHFEIRETAGIFQLYQMAELDPLFLLQEYYSTALVGVK